MIEAPVEITAHVAADLRRILMTVPGLPQPEHIKWEGRSYTPSPDTPYLEERLDPVGTINATLGTRGTVEDTYLYYLRSHMPLSRGTRPARRLVDTIRAVFWHGRHVGSAGPPPMAGLIRSAELEEPIENEGWGIHGVKINFFVRRPTLMLTV